ncbi:MAG: hypothetical protein FWD68_13425 [Alphaproteobacteria bacterium]|nr:hypothetical protein [Alphaproteobacteria bacterium]
MAARSSVFGLGLLAANLAVAAAAVASTAMEARSAPARPETVAASGVASELSRANPLRNIPLSQLTATRERPLFSPSRRPPPPVAVAAPAVVRPQPPKTVIRPPSLALVGTIIGEDEAFAIFLDPAGKAAFRLRIGEDHQGWRLQSIQTREVRMGNGEQAAVLTLPQPGAGSGETRLEQQRSREVPVAQQR